MEYRGHYIQDKVQEEKLEEVFSLESNGPEDEEVTMTNEEFSSFVDKLNEARDKYDKNTDFIVGVYSGIAEERYEENGRMSVFAITLTEETEEERNIRIEKEKKHIDEEIWLENEKSKKLREKNIKSAIEFLKNEGYDVKMKE